MSLKTPEGIAAARVRRAENEKKYTPEKQLVVLVADVKPEDVDRLTRAIMAAALNVGGSNAALLVSLVSSVETLSLHMGISRAAVRILADGIEQNLGRPSG